MSKTEMLLHSNDLPTGFEYYCGNYQAIPIGRHLSLFFLFLYTSKVISAIISLRAFIHYAINNIKQVNLTSPNALGDLTSLMEFTTSLVFAVGREYCDFCLPRAYLVNYFDMFTARPLIPDRCTYSNSNYLAAIKDSLNQVQQLLNLLICKEQVYSTIILRLIQLLVLIGLNESTFEQRVFDVFRRLYNKNKIFSIYLEEKSCLERLVTVLNDDLKEMSFDSLVIVHYHQISISKFAYLEKYGVKNLTYDSVEGFRSSLRNTGVRIGIGQNFFSRLLSFFDYLVD